MLNINAENMTKIFSIQRAKILLDVKLKVLSDVKDNGLISNNEFYDLLLQYQDEFIAHVSLSLSYKKDNKE